MCGLVYLLGVVALVAVFIPSVRCVCDPGCRAASYPADSAEAWRAAQLADTHSHGSAEDMQQWCGSIRIVSLYFSVALSSTAAAVHLAGSYYGYQLVHLPGALSSSKKRHRHAQRALSQSTLFARPGPGYHPTFLPTLDSSHRSGVSPFVGFGNAAGEALRQPASSSLSSLFTAQTFTAAVEAAAAAMGNSSGAPPPRKPAPIGTPAGAATAASTGAASAPWPTTPGGSASSPLFASHT